MDEARIRRLFVLKVWHDVVRDGLGTGPVDPARITGIGQARLPLKTSDCTQPVEPGLWLASVRDHYRFLDDEQHVARCSPADAYLVDQLVPALAHP